METVEIQLPSTLVQRIQQEASLDETLNQVVAEAVQMWLEKRQKEKGEKGKALQALRQAGVVMPAEKER